MPQEDKQERVQMKGRDSSGLKKKTDMFGDTSKVQLATREDLWEEDVEELPNDKLLVDPLIMVEVNIGGEITKAVIDTGATYSCISLEMYEKLRETGRLKGELPLCKVQLTTAIGRKKFKVDKQIWVEIMFGARGSNVLMFFVPGLFAPVLMGLNWLREVGIIIDCGHDTVRYEEDDHEISEEANLEGDAMEEKRKCLMSSIVTRRHVSSDWKDIGKRQDADGLCKSIKERCTGQELVECKKSSITRREDEGVSEYQQTNQKNERKCLDVISCNGILTEEAMYTVDKLNKSGLLGCEPRRIIPSIHEWTLL